MQKEKQTIALYGGSFDPPHIGHEAVVKALLAFEDIDKIIIMPTFLSPFKESSFAPANLRLHWLRDIFKSFKKVYISSYETDLQIRVPTLQTVEYLLESYKKVYLVIGADNLKSFDKWHAIQKLKSKVTVLVAYRDNIEIPKEYIPLAIDADISSSQLRETMQIDKLSNINANSIAQYYKENNER